MQDALDGLPGILEIETKLERDLFIIQYDPQLVQPAEIIEEIDALGFEAKQVSDEEGTAEPEVAEESEERSPLIDQLLEQAKRENKPLVLEFSGKWCGACRRLEQETLEDPKVEEALEKVIFRQILVEDDPAAARQFKMRASPQLRFITPGGQVVAEDKGVISVETMLGHLKRLRQASRLLPTLQNRAEIVELFEEHRGHPRLLLFLSPT